MAVDHKHCYSCVKSSCLVADDVCSVIVCRNQCGARFHACKEDEHISLCPREVVPCMNSQYGCPFRFEREGQGRHLQHCPASVVLCSHVWFRRNQQDSKSWNPDPLVPGEHIDFALALRDQDAVGGVESLRDLSVAPRPVPRVCQAVSLAPRTDAPKTLDTATFELQPEVQANASSSQTARRLSQSRALMEGIASLIEEGQSRFPAEYTAILSSAPGGESSDQDADIEESEIARDERAEATGVPNGSALETVKELEDRGSDSGADSLTGTKSPGSSKRQKACRRKRSRSIVSEDAPPAYSVTSKFRFQLQRSKRKISRVVTGAMGKSKPAVQPTSPLKGLRPVSHPGRSCSVKSRQGLLEKGFYYGTEGGSLDSDIIVLSGASSISSAESPRFAAANVANHSSATVSSGAGTALTRWKYEMYLQEGTALLEFRNLLTKRMNPSLLFQLSLFFSPGNVAPSDGLVQCQCSKLFRRDEIAKHRQFVHADVDSLLAAKLMYTRCPMSSYGCTYTHTALAMRHDNWSLALNKGSLAVRPFTGVVRPELEDTSPPKRHLTTLPVAALLRICAFLDPLSLSCLAETCRHLRSVVQSQVEQRGMVCPLWSKGRRNGSGVTWTLSHQWRLSSYVSPVPLKDWTLTSSQAMKQHLQQCELLEQDSNRPSMQWKPLPGLTDIGRLDVTSNSEADTGSEESADDGAADTPQVLQNPTRKVSLMNCVSPSSSVLFNRRRQTRSKSQVSGSLARFVQNDEDVCSDDNEEVESSAGESAK